MSILFAAALALFVPSPSATEGTPLASDLGYAMPIAGNWTYAASNDGSEADFTDSSGNLQIAIRCTRSTRRVSILKPATDSSPTLWVWTSSVTRTLPATYDPTARRVRADMGAFDPLLDAIASSRGRIGFSTSGLAALVVPPWADVAHTVEDCRV